MLYELRENSYGVCVIIIIITTIIKVFQLMKCKIVLFIFNLKSKNYKIPVFVFKHSSTIITQKLRMENMFSSFQE